MDGPSPEAARADEGTPAKPLALQGVVYSLGHAESKRSGRLAKVNRASCKWAATHQVVARPQLAEMDLGKPVSRGPEGQRLGITG